MLPTLARSVWTGPRPRYPISRWFREALGADVQEVDAFFQDDRLLQEPQVFVDVREKLPKTPKPLVDFILIDKKVYWYWDPYTKICGCG